MHPRFARLRTEIPRKGIHLFFGLIPLIYGILGSDWRGEFALVYGLLSVGILAVEWIRRQRETALAKFFYRYFGSTLRPQEIHDNKMMGATPYCLTAFVCVLACPTHIAVLALLFLAVGDAAASLVGITLGRIQIGRKTLEGSIAFWVSCSLVAWVAHQYSAEYSLGPAMLAAAVAAVGELWLQKLDDNLSVPALSASVMLLAPLAGLH